MDIPPAQLAQPLSRPTAARACTAAPEDLHPALWLAHQLGRPSGVAGGDAALSTGHPDLDAQIPGGGWPARGLTELLLPHPGVGELRLLAPGLAELQRQQRSLMWIDPPAAPCAWALQAMGIDVRQLVLVKPRPRVQALARSAPQRPGQRVGQRTGPGPGPGQDSDMLWALEQALKSGHLGAVLAWLPARLPADALRRLQLAAQAHDGPVFLFRDVDQARHPSPAPLRLRLCSAGPDLLRVDLLKRRGPSCAEPVLLALAPVLSAPALARALAARDAVAPDGPRMSAPSPSSAPASASALP